MRRGRWIALALALALLLLGGSGLAEAQNIAGSCRFWVSEGDALRVSDESMKTAWKPTGEAPELRIMLPEGGAAWIQINWTNPPTDYTLTEYDDDRVALYTHTAANDEFPCIAQLLPLSSDARYLVLTFSQAKQGINKIRIFPEGELPNTVVQWEAPHDKCDLMVISTHQDDEWLWFGAIIPYYDLVRDKKVQVVYMTDCGRYRYAEALNSLAVSGVRTYPMFVGLTDRRDDSLAAAIKTWKNKDHILSVMTALIRRFKPEVILTHDWDGEYGHPQHILTSRCMEYAIAAAADPEQYPESAQAFGAWQVKKLYRHLEKKGRIEFDWHVAYPEFGGRTGLQVAIDSMAEHASQLKYFHVEDHGEYDNALFGLSWSAVGDDALHEDLFENISDATPTPEPTASPEPTAKPEPTAEPTPEPAAEAAREAEPAMAAEAEASATPGPTSEPGAAAALDSASGKTSSPISTVSEARGDSDTLLMIWGGVALVAGVGCLFYARQRTRRRRRKKKKSGSSRKKQGTTSTGTKQGTASVGAKQGEASAGAKQGEASAGAKQGAASAGAKQGAASAGTKQSTASAGMKQGAASARAKQGTTSADRKQGMISAGAKRKAATKASDAHSHTKS